MEIEETGYDEIKSKIAINWGETKDGFYNENILISFEKETKKWILFDNEIQEKSIIKIPLDNTEIIRILNYCRQNIKISK
jgi:hypothetical protein